MNARSASLTAGDVGTFRGGSGFPPRFQGFKSGDLPFFKVSDMNTSGNELYLRRANNYVSEAQRKAMGATRIPAGAIVFAKVGAAIFLERKRILAQDSCIDNNMVAFIVDDTRVDVRFAHYLLGAFKISSLVATTALPSLNSVQLRSIPLLIPSNLIEQRRVVAMLSDADELISELERMTAKKQAVKLGMMQQLLTGKTRLRGFTEPWRDVVLGDHVTYVKTAALSRAQLDNESPTRYLHYGDIHTRTDVGLDAAHDSMPRVQSSLVHNAGRLQVGDLVFADASEDVEGVGKSVEIVAVPETGVVPGLHTIAARFEKAILADGFKGYLQFIPAFRQSLLRLAAGTKVLATTRSFISGITVTLPNVEEQRAIATALGDADTELRRLQIRLGKARDVQRGMMQELLSGSVRLPVEGGVA